MAGHSKKKYFQVFAALVVLTLIELGVAKVLRDNKALMIFLLIGLACAKAACVALYYMHLGDEKRGLKLAVSLPMIFPPLAALILMLEAIARFPGN